LIVPPLASTSDESCKIIDINYFLNLNFDASGVSISTDLRIPIVIGTIPLRNEKQQAENDQNQLSSQFQYLTSIFENTRDYGEEINCEPLDSDGKKFMPLYPYYVETPS